MVSTKIRDHKCARIGGPGPGRLFLSVATVKTHVARVLRKLGVRDRTQAVVAAFDLGIVRPRGSQPAARGVELIIDWG